MLCFSMKLMNLINSFAHSADMYFALVLLGAVVSIE